MEKRESKKRLIIIVSICIPIIIILAIIGARYFVAPTEEEIIEKVKNYNYYKSNVEFIIKNDKDVQRENVTMYCNKDVGTRMEFGEDRVKIFKDGKIKIEDNVSKSQYETDEKMDFLHSLAILNKILSYDVKSDTIESKQEEWANGQYIQVVVGIKSDIKHFDEAKVFIDKEKKSPIGIVVYDDNGNERVRIVYKEFEKLKEFDKDLL